MSDFLLYLALGDLALLIFGVPLAVMVPLAVALIVFSVGVVLFYRPPD